VAAALLLGFVLGGLVVGLGGRSVVERDPVTASSREIEAQVVARFVEHNLRLAQSYDPTEQLQLLTAMAADLRQEAFRLARDGAPEDLPLLSMLHERVLQRGLVGRARSLPAAGRAEQQAVLLAQLRQTEAEVEELVRQMPPAVADFLRPIGEAAGNAARQVAAGDPSPGPDELLRLPAGLASSRALLALLVTQSLLLAEEDDPLQRACHCNDMADQFWLALTLASTRRDTDRAQQLGKHLEAIMARGVSANLDRLQASDDPRVFQLKQVIQRVQRFTASLETSLAVPPGNPAAEEARYEQIKNLEKTLKDLERSLRDASKGRPPGKPPEYRGTVKSFDAAKGQLLVLVRDRGKEFEMTFRLAADVKVRGPGPQERTLADVVPGGSVRLLLREGNLVSEVRVDNK
jgi:hypothetical protein